MMLHIYRYIYLQYISTERHCWTTSVPILLAGVSTRSRTWKLWLVRKHNAIKYVILDERRERKCHTRHVTIDFAWTDFLVPRRTFGNRHTQLVLLTRLGPSKTWNSLHPWTETAVSRLVYSLHLLLIRTPNWSHESRLESPSTSSSSYSSARQVGFLSYSANPFVETHRHSAVNRSARHKGMGSSNWKTNHPR